MKVTGAYLAGVQKIELRDRELKPGKDQILVKTHLAGICGTDKNFYEGIKYTIRFVYGLAGRSVRRAF